MTLLDRRRVSRGRANRSTHKGDYRDSGAVLRRSRCEGRQGGSAETQRLDVPSSASSGVGRQPILERRARQFLKDALAAGPKRVSDVEAAAEKAHVDLTTLTQARGDLGVVTSRGDAGNTLSVQWSLPA